MPEKARSAHSLLLDKLIHWARAARASLALVHVGLDLAFADGQRPPLPHPCRVHFRLVLQPASRKERRIGGYFCSCLCVLCFDVVVFYYFCCGGSTASLLWHECCGA